jgi:hypothetical protein
MTLLVTILQKSVDRLGNRKNSPTTDSSNKQKIDVICKNDRIVYSGFFTSSLTLVKMLSFKEYWNFTNNGIV